MLRPDPGVRGRRASRGLSRELEPAVSVLMVQDGAANAQKQLRVRTGPKGVSYDVGDDARDAEVRHPQYCVLWGENRVGSHPAKQRQPGSGTVRNLSPQRASHSAGLGRAAPGCSFNGRCHLMPLEVGSGLRGWGATHGPLVPLLTCRARATVSTQQAVKQMEKPKRRRHLLPRSSTTNTWRGG